MDDMPSFFDLPFGCPPDEPVVPRERSVSAISPRRYAGSFWDVPGLVDDFRDYIGRGLSLSETARRLNDKYAGVNITRGACAGKASRLGLLSVSKPTGSKEQTWSAPGLTEDFVELHKSGIAYSGIAARLNAKYGLNLTKKAVLAKAHRLDLPKRENHTDGPRSRKKKGTGWKFPGFATRQAPQDQAGRLEYKRKVNAGEITPRLTKSPIPKEDDYTPLGMRKPLLELEAGECKWPYGDVYFTFCARPIGTSHQAYCEYHSLVHVYGLKGAMQFSCQAAE